MPNHGYDFEEWSGHVWTAANPLTVTMDFDTTIVTNFISAPPTASQPLISPNGGTFRKKVRVALVVTTPKSSIYYTIDGNDPTTSSKLYKKRFRLSGKGSKTVKAKAVKTGYRDSPVVSATFTIK